MQASAYLRLGAGTAALAVGLFVFGASSAAPENRELKLFNIHTKETIDVVFKRDGVYDKQALAQLNHFLRDWRKDRPTNMDPHLMDLLWSVYQESGSNDYIHVVCGYRSPETNAMLRRRSKMVAQHSQHMLGKATDFFIPGVPLAKLREIGLRMQVGGVGFYPTSGSPFVHMDTGSVRMWPRMTHDQLARVFPNGHTLYVPSDGKPLPGYDEALAAYKARQGAPQITVASAADDADQEDPDQVPIPRVAPARTGSAVVAMADGNTAGPQPLLRRIFRPGRVVVLTPRQRIESAHDNAEVDFNAAFDESAPSVPPALAKSMAARDEIGQLAATSLPIAPTAVVSTVDVTRPLRAEAITTAVLRTSGSPAKPHTIPELLAYAAPAMPVPAERPHVARASAAGIPIPPSNPIHPAPASDDPSVDVASVSAESVYARLAIVDLTMTALDTQTLRMWIADQSTREKRYALLTMPDFAQLPMLFDKPEVTFATGFSNVAYVGLRTDHFAGPLVQPPVVVDLTRNAVVAAR